MVRDRPFKNQEPAPTPGSPTCVMGPASSGWPLPLSQAVNWELNVEKLVALWNASGIGGGFNYAVVSTSGIVSKDNCKDQCGDSKV